MQLFAKSGREKSRPYTITVLLIAVLILCVLPIHAQDDIPDPMPMVDSAEDAIINVLLIGNATYNNANYPGLTDTLMIVSVNTESGHVGVVSIPRDLWVHVPDYGMYKINQTYYIAERNNPDTGYDTLKATIAHNIGLHIDYYAEVNFEGFDALIDELGGIDIAVDCAIEDWRLIEPHLDRQDPDNWEMFTLWSGLHHMGGDTALWYVRSRRTSNDLDRTRRQQDVVRAVWRKIRAEGILENLPTLWAQYQQMVDTDMTLHDALALVPIVAEVNAADIRYVTLRLNHELDRGYNDAGSFIFTARRDELTQTLRDLIAPTNRHRLKQSAPTVGIYNGTGIEGMDYVAAHRLEREGFRTVVTGEWTQPREWNLIVDRTGESKSSPLPILQRVLYITDAGVRIDPTPQRQYDYELHLGNRYQFSACTYPVIQPTREEEVED